MKLEIYFLSFIYITKTWRNINLGLMEYKHRNTITLYQYTISCNHTRKLFSKAQGL